MDDKAIEAILMAVADHLSRRVPTPNDEGVDEEAELARRIRSGNRSPGLYAEVGEFVANVFLKRALEAQKEIKTALADTREMPVKP
jgi:hypothetical protein